MSMTTFLKSALSSLIFLAGAAMAQTELVLAQRGEAPAYVIVLAADAGESVRFACEELQKTIALQTGVTLPIQDDTKPLPPKAILVGAPRHLAQLEGCVFPVSDKPDDAFSLKVVGPHLVSSMAASAARSTAAARCWSASAAAAGTPPGGQCCRGWSTSPFPLRWTKRRCPPSSCANPSGSITLTRRWPTTTRATATI
ncbi:MAG: hypothetical protein J5654_10450 [Victivallales bacterium]|nr:hypothetical protein [Victivallales bacterium]